MPRTSGTLVLVTIDIYTEIAFDGDKYELYRAPSRRGISPLDKYQLANVRTVFDLITLADGTSFLFPAERRVASSFDAFVLLAPSVTAPTYVLTRHTPRGVFFFAFHSVALVRMRFGISAFAVG